MSQARVVIDREACPPMIDAALEEQRAIGALTDFLVSRGFEVLTPGSRARPSLVACHPRIGIVALDILPSDGSAGDHDPHVALNRKVSGLRDDVPAVARTGIARILVSLHTAPPADRSLSLAQCLDGDWLDRLTPRPADDQVVAELRAALRPRLSVPVPSRQVPLDVDARPRAEARLELDSEQSRAAQLDVHDMLLITGPPGSGKTLVLIARARWLAAHHPDWHIQILCYNRVLVPYLRSLVADLPSVRVSTFGKFAHAAGYSVSLTDEDTANRQVSALARTAHPFVDAMLIDEAQDFMPAWTFLATALTIPGRGGTALAGDPQQALYRDPELTAVLAGRDVATVELAIPYRSTRQILDVTAALNGEFSIAGVERAPRGEPVDLVWGHSMSEQAAAVAWDIRLLLDGGERTAGDIAVLVTRKWDIGRVVAALTSANIPCRTIYPNQADDVDLAAPSVKILTVHSAKGYEFPVVFLVGLEHLTADGSSRATQDSRSGYVGCTRAKDQLVLTYTRDNLYLERVRRMPASTLRIWVWPDDYSESIDG
ncbi:3'-5' exonuclease [Actinotalea sp. AC32]|nr:3'-5' exonuclease [Actinotalea sp. AC32]